MSINSTSNGELAHVALNELALPVELVEAARSYFANARSPNTRRAYESDWNKFVAWCTEHGLPPCPAQPGAIALYITSLSERGQRISTLRRNLVAISLVHQAANIEPLPTRANVVRDVLKGIARAKGAPPKRAPALEPVELSAMLTTLGTDLRGVRDRALLTLGFAGAFRRATLVALRVEDVRFVSEGAEVLLRSDKNDPEHQGRTMPIAYARDEDRCPVRAVRAWLGKSGLQEGPSFAPSIVKAACSRAPLPRRQLCESFSALQKRHRSIETSAPTRCALASSQRRAAQVTHQSASASSRGIRTEVACLRATSDSPTSGRITPGKAFYSGRQLQRSDV